jgi:hypothetical protein
MEQQHPSIIPIESEILSKITPEDAETLVKFMLKMPAPMRIDSSMTWEDSNYIDRLLDTVRTLLAIRAAEQEVNNASI